VFNTNSTIERTRKYPEELRVSGKIRLTQTNMNKLIGKVIESFYSVFQRFSTDFQLFSSDIDRIIHTFEAYLSCLY
jgi:hypothetical protein